MQRKAVVPLRREADMAAVQLWRPQTASLLAAATAGGRLPAVLVQHRHRGEPRVLYHVIRSHMVHRLQFVTVACLGI